jgi:DNA polymerase
MAHPLTCDFESRSEGSLKRTGSWRYSEDPTTQVLCLAFRMPTWPTGVTGLWTPGWHGTPAGFDDPAKGAVFLDAIRQGHPVEAHNAWFERGLWYHKMRPLGFPEIGDTQWRCSMAKAAMCALPRGLDEAITAMGLPLRKDEAGAAIMRKMVTPRKPLKSERDAWMRQYAGCLTCAGKGKLKVGRAKAFPCPDCAGQGWFGTLDDVPPMPTLWHETPEMFEALYAYCRQDVLAEEALSLALPDLPASELSLYHLDQRMNQRGFRLDRQAVESALVLIDQESVEANAELAALTHGVVTRATQRARLLSWLEDNGCSLADTQGPTVDEALNRQDLTVPARRALVLLRALGKSSTAKYETMRDWMCADDRARGGLRYHGATTGRWAGAGIQPQNFPRGSVDLKDMDAAWQAIISLDPEAIAALGPTMNVLSSALRGALVPTPGTQFYVADFASIEARVLCWLADQTDALERFARNEDSYLDMATTIYRRPITKADKVERQLGKAAILGCGFQMGPSKFVETAATYGVELVEDLFCAKCGRTTRDHRKERHTFVTAEDDRGRITAVRVVAAYREKYDRVTALWQDIEQAAIFAADNEGVREVCGRLTWEYHHPFLTCTLPSGRQLYYPFPEIRMKKTPWGELREQLTFMGVDTYTRQWTRQSAYGGLLTENVVQATARDLMACALQRCEASATYTPILTVHDEVIAEAPMGAGEVHEFEALVAAVPDWATGCPVAAEGWRGPRYRK